jgi:hypothetical protein
VIHARLIVMLREGRSPVRYMLRAAANGSILSFAI